MDIILGSNKNILFKVYSTLSLIIPYGDIEMHDRSSGWHQLGLQCQKQILMTWISNYIPQNTVGYNHISMYHITVYGIEVLILGIWLNLRLIATWSIFDKNIRASHRCLGGKLWYLQHNYINPSYGLSLVDTLWNASSYRQPLEQEGNPMT